VGHLFKSGADYSQAAGPWARTGVRGRPRGSLHAHANGEVTSPALFSLKEGCAFLLRYHITIAKAWSGLHTYTSSVRRRSVGSPTMLSVGTELGGHERDRWDRIGYGMTMVDGGGARRSLFVKRKTRNDRSRS